MFIGRLCIFVGGILGLFFLLIFVAVFFSPGEDQAVDLWIILLLFGISCLLCRIGMKRVALYTLYKKYHAVTSSTRIETAAQLALAVNQPVAVVRANLMLLRAKNFFIEINSNELLPEQAVTPGAESTVSNRATVSVSVQCAGCGNNTLINGAGGTCEYCGSHVNPPASSPGTEA